MTDILRYVRDMGNVNVQYPVTTAQTVLCYGSKCYILVHYEEVEMWRPSLFLLLFYYVIYVITPTAGICLTTPNISHVSVNIALWAILRMVKAGH